MLYFCKRYGAWIKVDTFRTCSRWWLLQILLHIWPDVWTVLLKALYHAIIGLQICCFANYIHQTVADCQWNQSYQLSTFLILYFNVESIYLMKVVMFSQLAPSPKHPFRQPLFKKNFSKGNFKLTSTETITQTWNYYVFVVIQKNY